MTTPNEQQDELLSGYLDGELSRDEAAHLDFLLQRDPALGIRLAKLRQIRGLVKQSALVSSRTTTDFASRVIESARERGRELSLPPTHPIFLSESSSAPAPQSGNVAAQVHTNNSYGFTSRDDQSARRIVQRKLVLAAAAIAATVLIVVGVTRFARTPSGSSEFAAQPSDNGAGLVVDNIPTSNSVNSQDTPIIDEAISGDPSALPAPQPTNVDTLAANPTTEIPAENNMTEGLEQEPKAASTDAVVSNNLNNTDANNIESNVADNATPANSPSPRAQLVMVFDFVQSQDAWERNAFLQVLSAHDIAYERPLVADEDVTEALAESRFIGKDIAEENQAVEKVSLIYVRSRADRLDAAVREMMGNAQDFPSVHLDLAADAPGKEISKLLDAVKEFDEQEASMARPIIPSNNVDRFDRSAMVAQFPGGPRRGMELQGAFRQQSWVAPGNANGQSPVVTMLFIVRDQVE